MLQDHPLREQRCFPLKTLHEKHSHLNYALPYPGTSAVELANSMH